MTEESGTPGALVEDALHLIGRSFNEVIPPEAQLHFLNAQRELLLALAVIIEHNMHRERADAAAKRRRTSRKRQSRRPSKVTID